MKGAGEITQVNGVHNLHIYELVFVLSATSSSKQHQDDK